jgi:hypothetical protein
MSRISHIHDEYYDYDRYMGGDGPLITILRERKVRGRFEHKCSCCSLPIPRGELHTYFVYTDDEALDQKHKLRTLRTHLYCPPQE